MARQGYRAPDWLTLIVTDRSDRIVYSDVKGLEVGEREGNILSRLGEGGYGPPSSAGAPGRVPSCAYVETVEHGGEVLGSYYAFIGPLDIRSLTKQGGPYFPLIGLSCFALVAILGSAAVSALLAGSVMKLERAALGIASGDLETEVRLRGIREMGSLAETMDGMRKTLREDRDRRARFLAAVSHDLRTPLTSIGGYLEAVEDGLAADPETLSRYIGIMQGKTRLLENRIQGLIEFARMETGEWRVGFKPLALGPFLERLSREFAEDAKLLGLRFECEVSSLGGFSFPADEALLGRAIENIVSNAFRHSPQGGLVRISSRPARAGEPACLVDIDDEGPGIPLADRDKVFEPFYRVSPGLGEGNGLGLYIAKSVLRGHGWDLGISDSPSGGARFTLRLEP